MAISSNATGLRPGVCTSTTRPTAPYTGQIIFETDTGYLRVWDGSAWDYFLPKQDTVPGEWTSFTPTLTQPGAITKTVTYAKYTTIGKLCICNVRMDVTGTGTAGNSLVIGLPLTAATGSTTIRIGSGELYDSSTATTYDGMMYLFSTTTMVLRGDWAGANDWGVVPNLAIGNGDQVNFSVHYEIA